MYKTLFFLLIISIVGLLSSEVVTIFFEDFENGADDWVIVNGTLQNHWRLGNAPANSQGNTMYISNNAETGAHAYNILAGATVHFYRDVLIPDGAIGIQLSFDLLSGGQIPTNTMNGDYLRVFLHATTITPTASSMNLTTANLIGNDFYNLTDGWERIIINIPPVHAGQNRRLVFSWRNDWDAGDGIPAAVDNIHLTYVIPPPEPLPARLVSPFNNSILISRIPALRWMASDIGNAATGFKLNFGTDQDDWDVVENNITVTSWSPSESLLPNTTYYWQIIPFNAEGNAENCPVWSFTTTPEGFVAIGDGRVIQDLPIHPLWRHSYSQSIYLQEEINTPNNQISRIFYHWNGVNAAPNSNAWTIYMGHTDKPNFTSSSDWINHDHLIEVFTGVVPIVAQEGWIEIVLDRAFAYNNTQNLVIAVNQILLGGIGGGDGSEAKFFGTTTSDGRSIRAQSNTLVDIYEMPTMGVSLVNAFPNILLEFEELPNEPVFVVNPESWNFGTRDIFTTSTPQNFTITNFGGDDLEISSIEIVGTDSSHFILTNNNMMPSIINPTENISFTVTFAPTSAGLKTSNVVIFDNASRAVRFIPITGLCVDGSFTLPFTEDFENAAFAQFPPAGWLRMAGLLPEVENAVLSPVNFQWTGQIEFPGVENHHFGGVAARILINSNNVNHWLITPPINLGVGNAPKELVFDIAMTSNAGGTPQLNGDDDRFIVLISTDQTTWNAVNIIGLWDNEDASNGFVFNDLTPSVQRIALDILDYSGFVRFAFYGESTVTNANNFIYIDNIAIRETPTMPIFSVSPTFRDFGTVEIGNTSAIQNFTIINIGSGTLTLSSIELFDGSGQFDLINNNPAIIELEANERVTIGARFIPQYETLETATIKITEISGTIHNIELSGTGRESRILSFPYIETFSEIPQGWRRGNGTLALTGNSHITFLQPTTSWTQNWTSWHFVHFGNVPTHPNGQAIAYRFGSDFDRFWLFTPTFYLMEDFGPYNLEFDLALTGNGSSNPAVAHESDAFVILVSTDFGATWNINNTIARWDNADNDNNVLNDIPNTGDTFTVSLAEFSGQSVQIAFYGERRMSAWGNNATIHLDNVSIVGHSIPTIYPPQNLTGVANNTFIRLDWETPEDDGDGTLVGYRVFRNGMRITETIVDLFFVDINLVNYVEYTYHIVAVYTNPNMMSEPSNSISISPTGETLRPANNLVSNFTGEKVILSWEEPMSNIFTHAKSNVHLGAIGESDTGPSSFMVAQRFTPEMLVDFGVAGKELTAISFMGNHPQAFFEIIVWTGGSGFDPGDEVYAQEVENANFQQWTEVELTTPIQIPTDEELWIGYYVWSPNLHPAGTDLGHGIPGFGDLVTFDGENWVSMFQEFNLNRNWMVRGHVGESNSSSSVVLYNDMKISDENKSSDNRLNRRREFSNNATKSLITSTTEKPFDNESIQSMNRAFVGYLVYRRDAFDNSLEMELLTPFPITELTFTDDNIEALGYFYQVRAVYSTGISEPINTILLTLLEEFVVDTFPWTEGFETPFFPPAGWITHDVDGDGHNWYAQATAFSGATPVFQPRTGIFSAASFSWNHFVGMANQLYPDNWLITPRISLPNPTAGITAEFRYFTRISAGMPESYQILISTKGTEPEDFSIIFEEILTSGTWVERVICLSAFEGHDIYIAFRHYFTELGRRLVQIDDLWLGYKEATIPVFSIYPNEKDFGKINIESVSDNEFTITNLGVGDLVVGSIFIEGDDTFTIENLDLLPVYLATGDDIEFIVRFSPTESTVSEAILIVMTNLGRYEVSLTGTGSSTPLSITLSSFNVIENSNRLVEIYWITESEMNIEGFNILRSITSEITTAQVVSPLIPARNTTITSRYEFLDEFITANAEYFYWLRMIGSDGTMFFEGPRIAVIEDNIEEILPMVTEIKNLFPNPLRAGDLVYIDVSVKANETANFQIFNIRGQLVHEVNAIQPGAHRIKWDGRDRNHREIASGVYFYRLSSESSMTIRRMVIIK